MSDPPDQRNGCGAGGGEAPRSHLFHACLSGACMGGDRWSCVVCPPPRTRAEKADPCARVHHQTRTTLLRLLSVIILSLSVSMDALCAGVAYGLKGALSTASATCGHAV